MWFSARAVSVNGKGSRRAAGGGTRPRSSCSRAPGSRAQRGREPIQHPTGSGSRTARLHGAPRTPSPSPPASAISDQPMLRRPAGQLVAARQLELAQHVRDVALDGLDGEVEARRDLLVHVAARDELEDFALARRQLVQLRVAGDLVTGPKRVEDEAGEARREDGVALCDALDRSRELVTADRLR